jgi:hypothetical protein
VTLTVGSRPFGAGLLRSVPFAGRMPFTVQDQLDAAAMFADDASEPDWDALAIEAEYQASHESQAPSVYGVCLACNQTFDYLEPNGLCPKCDVHGSETSTPNLYR